MGADNFDVPPADICCPITGQPFRDPVRLPSSGFVFERDAILEWFAHGHTTCPCSRKEVNPFDLVPASDVLETVAEWTQQSNCALNRVYSNANVLTANGSDGTGQSSTLAGDASRGTIDAALQQLWPNSRCGNGALARPLPSRSAAAALFGCGVSAASAPSSPGDAVHLLRLAGSEHELVAALQLLLSRSITDEVFRQCAVQLGATPLAVNLLLHGSDTERWEASELLSYLALEEDHKDIQAACLLDTVGVSSSGSLSTSSYSSRTFDHLLPGHGSDGTEVGGGGWHYKQYLQAQKQRQYRWRIQLHQKHGWPVPAWPSVSLLKRLGACLRRALLRGSDGDATNAAWAIWLLSINKQRRDVLLKRSTVEALVCCLAHSRPPGCRAAAARALRTFAMSPVAVPLFVAAAVVPALITQMHVSTAALGGGWQQQSGEGPHAPAPSSFRERLASGQPGTGGASGRGGDVVVEEGPGEGAEGEAMHGAGCSRSVGAAALGGAARPAPSSSSDDEPCEACSEAGSITDLADVGTRGNGGAAREALAAASALCNIANSASLPQFAELMSSSPVLRSAARMLRSQAPGQARCAARLLHGLAADPLCLEDLLDAGSAADLGAALTGGVGEPDPGVVEAVAGAALQIAYGAPPAAPLPPLCRALAAVTKGRGGGHAVEGAGEQPAAAGSGVSRSSARLSAARALAELVSSGHEIAACCRDDPDVVSALSTALLVPCSELLRYNAARALLALAMAPPRGRPRLPLPPHSDAAPLRCLVQMLSSADERKVATAATLLGCAAEDPDARGLLVKAGGVHALVEVVADRTGGRGSAGAGGGSSSIARDSGEGDGSRGRGRDGAGMQREASFSSASSALSGESSAAFELDGGDAAVEAASALVRIARAGTACRLEVQKACEGTSVDLPAILAASAAAV